jgi:hypothetical protein
MIRDRRGRRQHTNVYARHTDVATDAELHGTFPAKKTDVKVEHMGVISLSKLCKQSQEEGS